MRKEIPLEASRLALLLVLANGEDDEAEFDRLSAEVAKHDDLLRRGMNEILCTVTVQLLKHVHPNDWLDSIRLQLLHLDIDPDHYMGGQK